jgi:RNA polymerase sporulation-specific sigma factor
MTNDKYSLHNNENIARAKVDREYLGELLLENEDLIWFSIRNYVGDPVKLAQYNLMEKEDIQQVGSIGFINAVKNFDCSKGVLFTTYAPAVIAGEVKDYLRDKGRLIRLPRSAHDLNTKVMNYTEDIYYDKFIPAEEVAERIDEDTDKVRKVLTVGSTPLLIPFCKKGKYNSENESEMLEYEGEDKSVDIENQVVEKIYLDQLLETIRSKLSERDKRILDGKLEGKTHEQIANEEDISKITITRTLNKIRKIYKEIKK